MLPTLHLPLYASTVSLTGLRGYAQAL